MLITMDYKQKDGKILYGFSQTNLDRTNAKLNSVVVALKILIVLFILFMVSMATVIIWLGYNDVITRLIYGF